jgi:hypothetical protein
VGPEKGHISNAVCAVIGQVVALKRAIRLKPGAPDGCQEKLVSQRASPVLAVVFLEQQLGDCRLAVERRTSQWI